MVIATCTTAILARGPPTADHYRRGSISGVVITANSIAHVRLTVTDIE